MLLTLLAILVAALLLLGIFGRLLPRHIAVGGMAGIAAVVVITVVAALAAGETAVTPLLPVDPAARLVLDPLAASFLLLLFLVAPCAAPPPLRLAGIVLAVLAGDAVSLAAGLLLLGGREALHLATAAATCFAVAVLLVAPSGDFAAFRAMPPEGWLAVAILVLSIVGAGVVARSSPPVAVYLLLRVLFDLCGVAQPLWWGVPVLLLGAGIAVAASLRAVLVDSVHGVARAVTAQPLGMSVLALGVALLARAIDLPAVLSLALAAAWLALASHGFSRTLLLLCADAVEAGAGSRHLDRLGGLIHGMPLTAGCCLAGLLIGVALPPALGFAAFWLLFQVLLGIARGGDFPLQLLVAAGALVVALSAALNVLAAVRLFGVAFLGRPRTPRAAVVEEPPRLARCVMIGVAGSALFLGALPALALLPAQAWTHATVLPLTLSTGAESPGYAPPVILGLLAVAAIGVFRALRVPGERGQEPLWHDGFAAPPPWLPFGDPATQIGSASFAEPAARVAAALPPIPWHRWGVWGAALRRAVLAVVPP